MPYFSFAQALIKFQHFGHDEGLTNIAVRGIVQDSQGFIWHGSLGGLYKYDGYNYTLFQHDPEDTTSISSNYIRDVILDRNNNLWIATAGYGLNLFERKTESFRRFMHDDQDPNSLANNLIFTLLQDQQGYIWIGLQGSGLDKLDPETLQFSHYPADTDHTNGLKGSYVLAIEQDREGFIWAGTSSGVNRMDPSTGKFIFYSPQSEEPFHMDGDGRIRTIYQDREGFIWIGSFTDLKRYDPNSNTFKIYQKNPENPYSIDAGVWSICETMEGKFWLGNYAGLSLLNRKTGKFTRYQNDPLDPNTIDPGRIDFLFEDRQGGIWCRGGQGLNYFHPLSARFQYMLSDPADVRAFGSNYIFSIINTGEDKILIATASGLYTLHPEEDHIEPYLPFKENPHDLNNNPLNAVAQDSAGTLWIGTRDNGLFSYKPGSKEFKHFTIVPKDPRSLSHSNVHCIFMDRTENLWIGTQRGLNRLNAGNGIIHRFLHNEKDTNSISHNVIQDILEDSEGDLWVATIDGLNRINSENEIVRYYHDPHDPQSLNSDYISAILEDHSGILWLATGGGLSKLEDKERGVFRRYTVNDGLPTHGIRDMAEDGQGHLWLATDFGISKLDPEKDNFINLTSKDGLIANEFSCIFYNAQNNRIYAGTKKGFNLFQPDDIRPNPYLPPVTITRYKNFQIHKDEMISSVDENIGLKSMIKTSNNDILSFEFSALNYYNSSNNKYAYKLEGVSDKWIHLGHERSVTFANLRPGDYTLHIKGSNNDGLWNEEGTSLKIMVIPPWYKSDLANLFYLILGFSILYVLYRFQLKRKLEQEEMKRILELDKLKDKLYSNVVHGFRTPLTVIEGMSDMILNRPRNKQVESIQAIKRNSKNVLSLINQMLDLRKLESGNMPLNEIQADIVQYVRYISDSFRPLTESKGIRLHILANVQTLIMDFDPDKILQILSNLISNGIKFTEEGDIYVQVSEINKNDDNVLELRVKDTGVGIQGKQLPFIFNRFYQADHDMSEKMGGTGIGLALTREIVKVLEGDISVSSSVGKGTEFVVILPINHDAKFLKTSYLQTEIDSRIAAAYPASPLSTDAVDFSHFAGEHRCLALIIEDNLDMTTYLVASLEDHYRLIITHDGKDGLKEALEHVPDVIISDVMMPGMDGYEVCTALKEDERTSHIPIILLTAMADAKSRIEGLERGADAYLAKPFNRMELLVRIRKLIELRLQLHERYSNGIPPTRFTKKFAIEDQFLRKLKEIIEDNMDDTNFGLVQLCRAMGLSRSQLFRKIKALTGKSTSIFIRTIRLNKAKEILKNSDLNVSEVAYEVGFKDLAYFSRTFTEEFGINPSKL